jgi:hypothetical protein
MKVGEKEAIMSVSLYAFTCGELEGEFGRVMVTRPLAPSHGRSAYLPPHPRLAITDNKYQVDNTERNRA